MKISYAITVCDELEEIKRLVTFLLEHKRDEEKNDRQCFDLVYPVTFILPDGSSITVTDREDWEDLKGRSVIDE